MYAASFVIFVVVDVPCPRFAPHLHHGAIAGTSELGEDERRLVTLLVHEREESLQREAELGEELHLPTIVVVAVILRKVQALMSGIPSNHS